MRYRPFSFENHPKIRSIVGRYIPDFITQRTTRNIRYFDDVLSWVTVALTGNTSYRVALNDEAFQSEGLSLEVLRALSYALSGLEEADAADVAQSQRVLQSQFEVTKAFRFFTQTYGGRRYVELCRDLIDANMGGSLQPYMLEDLILSVFSGFNKNVGKDVEGLLYGIAEMCAEAALDEETQRRLFVTVGARSSLEAYATFAVECLNRERLRKAMSEIIVEGYIPSKRYPRTAYPLLDAKTLLTLNEEDLLTIIQNLPSGMRDLAIGLFEEAGEDRRQKLIDAYLQNKDKDTRILASLSYFGDLPDSVKKRVFHGNIFSKTSRNLDIIRYFVSCETDEEREEVLHYCASEGREDLGLALQGKACSMRYFTCEDVTELLPRFDLSDPDVAKSFGDFLLSATTCPAHDRLIRKIDGPLYAGVAQALVEEGHFQNPATKLFLIDRFHLMPHTYKEWKYHA